MISGSTRLISAGMYPANWKESFFSMGFPTTSGRKYSRPTGSPMAGFKGESFQSSNQIFSPDFSFDDRLTPNFFCKVASIPAMTE